MELKSLITLSTQTLIAIGITITFLYCIVSGTSIPDYFQAVWGLVVGYYFAKNGNTLVKPIISEGK